MILARCTLLADSFLRRVLRFSSPQGGPPPDIQQERGAQDGAVYDVHRRRDEAIWVLEGEIEILDGERVFAAGPGSFFFIPKGTVHGFRNVGMGATRFLSLAVPAGFEGLIEEVGRTAREGEEPPPATPEEAERFMALAPRYDSEIPPSGA